MIPGIHDHHVHLMALAASADSVPLGPPLVTDRVGFVSALRAAEKKAPPGSWIRGVGYHESVAGEIDRDDLDSTVSSTPVRIQHRSGGLWVLNSMALSHIGVSGDTPHGLERDGAGRPTGRLWRLDDWLRKRLADRPVDLGRIGREAAALGITGFTDATPGDLSDVSRLADGVNAEEIPQRVRTMTAPGIDVSGLFRGVGNGRVSVGPTKILLDDDRLPTYDEMIELVRSSHESGRPVAVHCVTRVQAVLTCAALEATGARPGDRIEHGAVISEDLAGAMAHLGLAVVTQPGFVETRGDRYLQDVDPDDLPDLWRLRSLIDAGIAVAASSDAPFGPLDPWRAIASATSRRTASGAPLGPLEAVTADAALDLYLARPEDLRATRTVAPGEGPDLCVVTDLATRPNVLATIVAGRVVFQTG